MASDIREVANAILAAAEAAHLRLTNMSLNKIAYFAHAAALAHYGRPLVDSPFEAWQYGPVHPQLYRQLKRFKDQPVTGRLTRVDMETGRDIPYEVRLGQEEKDLVDRITVFYGGMPAGRLVEISHESGAPWDQVWAAGEKEARPGMIISDSSTESFYKAKFARSS